MREWQDIFDIRFKKLKPVVLATEVMKFVGEKWEIWDIYKSRCRFVLNCYSLVQLIFLRKGYVKEN